ncbi:hypothetical protein FQA39_LY09677 [Lamprigera yunnana]|nr:hypothetical protein FQA39_LY09677 [Lamprigera yunnana]
MLLFWCQGVNALLAPFGLYDFGCKCMAYCSKKDVFLHVKIKMSLENTTVNKKKTTNWTLCCFCQQDIRKDLRCSYEKECHHKSYKVLEVDLKNFVDNEVPMPLDVNVECLGDCSGIENTMKTNKITYHNGYRAFFRSDKLQRQLKKREMDSANVGAAMTPKKRV